MDTSNNLESVITAVGATLAVVIPTVAALYYKLSKQWKSSLETLKHKDQEKMIEILKNYTYSESLKSTSAIKAIVNMYRDKSLAEVVCYYSLEDGTVAESKLHNLYITMIAESDRFSSIPRYLSKVQRVPIPQVIDLISKVNESRDGVDSVYEFDSVFEDEKTSVVHEKVKSVKVRPVSNADGYTIGYVAFLYQELTYEDYSILLSQDKIKQEDIPGNIVLTKDSQYISECRAVIESEFVKYSELVRDKRVELGLDKMNINYEKK